MEISDRFVDIDDKMIRQVIVTDLDTGRVVFASTTAPYGNPDDLEPIFREMVRQRFWEIEEK